MIESNEYRELCRRDFATFAQRAFIELYPDEQLDWNWHQDVIIDRLERFGGVRPGGCLFWSHPEV